MTALLTIVSLLPCRGIWAETNRPGMVQFSNGDTAEGLLSLTPDSELKIHTGKELKTVSLDQVQNMVFEPEKETMEKRWRFVEAGRTQKETWGQPYPVREIRVVLSLADGTVIRGHVYTTVLYLERKEQTTKVVLRAKDRGNEGQTFADLVYPVRISFTDKATPVTGTITIKVKNAAAAELVALTPGVLLRLPATRTPDGGAFRLVGLLTPNAFLAVRTASGVSVGWPADADTGLVARVQQALVVDEDFLHSKTLLGVQRQGDDVYSLLMLSRKGRTTLDQEKSQPWRIEIWRWKDDGDRLMAAGRGYFFRGILRKDEAPPAVVLSPKISKTELKDGAELP